MIDMVLEPYILTSEVSGPSESRVSGPDISEYEVPRAPRGFYYPIFAAPSSTCYALNGCWNQNPQNVVTWVLGPSGFQIGTRKYGFGCVLYISALRPLGQSTERRAITGIVVEALGFWRQSEVQG